MYFGFTKKKIQFYYNAFVQTMYMFYTFRQHCNNFEKIKKLLENIFSVPVDRSIVRMLNFKKFCKAEKCMLHLDTIFKEKEFLF